jgi:LPXTG-motif cell wall-anchored protein
MSEDNLPNLLQRAWRFCLLAFGCVLLLWLAVQLLSQMWGWLLLIALIIGLVAGAVLWFRRRRDRW